MRSYILMINQTLLVKNKIKNKLRIDEPIFSSVMYQI